MPDVTMYLSLCENTEPSYWCVEAAALTEDTAQMDVLRAAFLAAVVGGEVVRLIGVRVTTGEDGRPRSEVLRPKFPPFRSPEVVP